MVDVVNKFGINWKCGKAKTNNLYLVDDESSYNTGKIWFMLVLDKNNTTQYLAFHNTSTNKSQIRTHITTSTYSNRQKLFEIPNIEINRNASRTDYDVVFSDKDLYAISDKYIDVIEKIDPKLSQYIQKFKSNLSVQEYFIKKVDESDYERKSYNQLPECSVQKNGKVNFYYVPLKNGNLKLCLNGVKIPEYKNLNGVEVIPYQNTYPNKYSQRIYFKDCKLSEVKDFLDNILKQLDIIPSNSAMRNLIIKYAEYKKSSEYDEQYKYDYAYANKGVFNDLTDLENKIKSLGNPNFNSYFIGRCSGLRHLLSKHFEELTEALSILFGNDDLKNRIILFKEVLNEKLKNDTDWHNKNILVDVQTASYFLFTNDYENNLLFTKTSPYNKFAKILNLTNLLQYNSDEERYINWQEYCKNELLPEMDRVLNKKHTLLDAQDFIWFIGNNNETKVSNNEQDEDEKMQLNIPLNQILYGPPGTGKTYNTVLKAMSIIDGVEYKDVTDEEYTELKNRFDELKQKGQIEFVTFHQSYSYEEFVEGIKPNLDNENLGYKLEDGIFKQICYKAKLTTQTEKDFDEVYNQFILENKNIEKPLILETPSGSEFGIKFNSKNNIKIYTGENFDKNTVGVITKEYLQEEIFKNGRKCYVEAILNYLNEKYQLNSYSIKNNEPYILIIDEINRGDVSKIFGELITLIEEDKRLDNKYQMETTLPYSKEQFGVPNNLYIIGTMNTADRSIALLDTALRRRFDFEEIMPRPELLAGKVVAGINLEQLLKRINQRVTEKYDRDHQIGHSYLMGVETEKDLERAYKNRILPLLNEYFYNDTKTVSQILNCSENELQNNFLDVLNKAQNL